MKKIVLCGSTRFKRAFAEWNARLTLEGNVVLSVAMWSHSDRIEPTPAQKEVLDKVHLAKIDIADEVFVLDVGGYTGESTKREIDYARFKGNPVRFLSYEYPSWTEDQCIWWQAHTEQRPLQEPEGVPFEDRKSEPIEPTVAAFDEPKEGGK